MSSEFFNRQVPAEKWKAMQGFIEEYDENERNHAHSTDIPLTGDLLLKITDVNKYEKLQIVTNMSIALSKAAQAALDSSSSTQNVDDAKKAYKEIGDLQLVLDNLKRKLEQNLPSNKTIKV